MIQKSLLDSAEKKKGKMRIIKAQMGKSIKLPWFQKESWVSIPVTALGCSGTIGTLSTDALWIQPKSRTFGTDASSFLFRVNNEELKLGKEYHPRIIIKTDAGVLRQQLILKKAWPWLLLEAAALVVAIGCMVMIW